MNDNAQLIGQILAIGLGPLIATHKIPIGNDDIAKIAGALVTLGGIVWKFWHWNKTPDAPAPATPPLGGALHLLLICALLPALCLGTVGCKNPQQASYAAVGTVQVSVEAAMSAWNLYVGQNHPPVATELKVKAAYEKYQQAMAAVCDAGAIYAAAGVTNSAGQTGASAALQAATSNAGQTLADLVALIRSLGVKI